ncbi:MAG TPA: 3-deoxy-8-phosphooctulonate synthase [bacterium]|nr:3-deoxy-8-phosphooctulonate synthase [bacterium]HOL47610.1 3-deoxy-8-phosphooctulonate synthase [bacterium]HPQ19410.1 3-deoxy-8-phosphooctulonate synthase [bacterium]
MKVVEVGNIKIGGNNPLAFILGPCIIENDTYEQAKELKKIMDKFNQPFIFKCSWDKANRTGYDGYRGFGIDKGIEILMKIKKDFNLPVLTDFHIPEQAEKLGKYFDVLQVPAYLTRQTDMLFAAGKYAKVVNIKKAQFMNPLDMKKVISKIEYVNNKNILVTERGTCFGYDDLVVDFRSFVIMKKFGYPVIFDATHSIKIENPELDQKEFIEPLAKAAIAIGVDGLFMEVHPDCSRALCDGKWMLPFERLEKFMEVIKK